MVRVILSGHLEVPLVDLDAVRQELSSHIEATLAENGCITFEVVESAERAGRFTVYEEFSSRETFELHQERVANSRWGQVAASATRYYTVTEVGPD